MAKRGAWKKAGDSVLTVVLILLSLRLGVKFLLDGGRGRRDFTSCWVWLALAALWTCRLVKEMKNKNKTEG